MFLLVTILAGFTIVNGQSYNYNFTTTDGHNGYEFNEAVGTIILDESTSSADLLSEWQELPFDWDFYGNSVSGYFVTMVALFLKKTYKRYTQIHLPLNLR